MQGQAWQLLVFQQAEIVFVVDLGAVDTHKRLSKSVSLFYSLNTLDTIG